METPYDSLSGSVPERKHWRIRIDELSAPFSSAFLVRFFDAWMYNKGGPIQDMEPVYSSDFGADPTDAFNKHTIGSNSWELVVSQNPIGKSMFIDFPIPVPFSVFHSYPSFYGGNVCHISAVTVFARDDPDDPWEEIWSDRSDPFFGSSWAPTEFKAPNPAPLPDDYPLITSGGYGLYGFAADAAEIDGDAPLDGEKIDKLVNIFSGTTAGDATQSSAALQPVYREGGFNDRPYIEVSGAEVMTFALDYPSGLTTALTEITVVCGEFERVGTNTASYVVGASNLANGGKARVALVYSESGVQFSTAKPSYLTPAAPDLPVVLGAATTLSAFVYMFSDGSAIVSSGNAGNSNNPTSTAITTGTLFASGNPVANGLKGRLYGVLRVRDSSNVVSLRRAVAWAEARFLGLGTADVPTVDIAVPPAALALAGSPPQIAITGGPVLGLPGDLTITGASPDLASVVQISGEPGQLDFEGSSPSVSVGISIGVEESALVIDGAEPVLYTVSGTLASQSAVLAVADAGPPPALSSQVAVMAVAEPPPPPVRASQAAVMTIGEVVPDVCASQAAVLVVGHQTDCVTSLCQIWKITRRDGKVYRYTSLDRDVVYGGHVYKACGSMDPSASDNSATFGSVGSQTLTGVITDDGITEAELFGGLFDDAYVTSDLISYEDPTFIPKRLASGWIGKITQGRIVHSLEVVSIGARIEQQALVRVVAPTCSHKFGDAGCGVNAEALKIPATITRVMDRGLFYVSVVKPADDGRQWANGRVRFLSGVNAGVVREFKTIDFDDGRLALWSLTGLAPAVGDEIEIIPGCDLTREGGCTAYQNVINFGGFPDVPGTDAIMETPDAKA